MIYSSDYRLINDPFKTNDFFDFPVNIYCEETLKLLQIFIRKTIQI